MFSDFLSSSMAGEKQAQNFDSMHARKYIRSLAKELVSDSEMGFVLARNRADLEDALQKSAESLPAGKLRSTLLHILQHKEQGESFVCALQTEIRAASARLELQGDVLLTSPASDRFFEALVTFFRDKGTSAFKNTESMGAFSHEDIHLLLFRDPAPHVLWAMAAMEMSFTGGSFCKRNLDADGADNLSSSIYAAASAFLHCLKPWIVGRNASIALAALAPLVPIAFETLKQSSNNFVTNIKELRTLVKEVLSFIVAVNYREQLVEFSFKNGSKETLPFVALFDGFEIVYEALKLEGITRQMKGLSSAEKLKLMFPLASELSKKVLKPSDTRIVVLADLVKVEFVLLHMVLEVIYHRQKRKAGDKFLKSCTASGLEQAGCVAASGVVALQHDLLLDVLLSDLAVSNLLDDEEKSFVCLSIFKASLMGDNVFSQKSPNENFVSKRKALEIFLKQIAVARKINANPRVARDTLPHFGTYLKAPRKLSDYLQKFCGAVKSLPEQELRNDQVLIGWLLHLDDAKFQAVVEGTSHSYSQTDKMGSKEEDVCAAKRNDDGLSVEDDCRQADPEALFFVDTTGEEKHEIDAKSLGKGRKNRKRKERQVLFHRHGRVTEKKKECLNEDLSDSSLEVMTDDRDVVRKNRVIQEDDDSLTD